MEYNKQLYTTLSRIEKSYIDLQKELELLSPNELSKITLINKELKSKSLAIEKFKQYKKILQICIESEKILNDSTQKELHDIAQSDLNENKNKIFQLEKELKLALLPVDSNADKNIIIEMRPAAGGDESEIFLANLFDAYRNYIDKQRWKIKILDSSPSPYGYNFLMFEVSGNEVYPKLKFESGVHRVQRVPATEVKGRVHTSTITVAVLPVQDEIEIKIDPKDLRIDTYRSSGAGGQHVNRTESAVRITHLPTNIMVSCQEGKSQIENRETAMKMLRSKLWEKAEAESQAKNAATRKSQVGSGSRSEKIRTYNYPQNRVTDHRIGLSLNKLDRIMIGDLEELIEALRTAEQAELMSELDI